ncbi:MAG: LPS export ABC transporter periplasmic protein LptC, partial [Balneolaceae bacterium]
ALNHRQEEGEETRIKGPVYVQIYDSTGTLESEAWSARAVYYAESGEFELYDSVRVETANDRRLQSDYLKWAEETDNITSDRLVTIITPADSISGTGFTGKTDLSRYVITNPRGRLIVN